MVAEGHFSKRADDMRAKAAVEQMVQQHPLTIARGLAGKINAGVFGNGESHQVTHGDVLGFVRNTDGDVLYADFPYPGTLDYAVSLRPLDEMLAGRELTPERSRFGRDDAMLFIEETLDAATHIPVWAISLGGPVVELESLEKLVRKHKPQVHAEAVKYTHLAGLSSAESNAKNRELIVVGRT